MNKVILIGAVCGEPGFVYSAESEEAIFPLKTSISKRQVTRTDAVQWHRVVLRGRLLETCKNIRKNAIVYVEGALSTSFSKINPDGNERVFNSEVVASDIKILSKSLPSFPCQNLTEVLMHKIRNKL